MRRYVDKWYHMQTQISHLFQLNQLHQPFSVFISINGLISTTTKNRETEISVKMATLDFLLILTLTLNILTLVVCENEEQDDLKSIIRVHVREARCRLDCLSIENETIPEEQSQCWQGSCSRSPKMISGSGIVTNVQLEHLELRNCTLTWSFPLNGKVHQHVSKIWFSQYFVW